MPIDINAVARRLERLIPLFAAYTPDGWVDFRDKELSLEWRGGLYIRAEDESETGFLEMKAIFGCKPMAALAAHEFHVATGLPALLDGGGERLWSVTIKIPESEVCW